MRGIAKSVKILCDALGLWCIIAVSENNPAQGVKYRHAWNIVRLDGQYYHLDATFDNSLGGDGVIRYDYFNLDDKKIFRDHEPFSPMPPPAPRGTDSSTGSRSCPLPSRRRWAGGSSRPFARKSP